MKCLLVVAGVSLWCVGHDAGQGAGPETSLQPLPPIVLSGPDTCERGTAGPISGEELQEAASLANELMRNHGLMAELGKAAEEAAGIIAIQFDKNARMTNVNGFIFGPIGGYTPISIYRANTERLWPALAPLLRQQITDAECRLRQLGVDPPQPKVSKAVP